MKLVRRFTTTELVYHWVQALPYLSLVVTGGWLLAGRFLEPGSEARETLRLVHLVAAALLVLGPALVLLAGDARALLENAREAFRWERRDVQWLIAMHLRPGFPDWPMPEVGKFNPGQKVNLLVVMLGIPAFAASGLVMLLWPGVLLAWYLHLATFAVALPMLLVHLFMACINPSTRHALRGIFSGHVHEEWAAHHHGAWLREVLARGEGAAAPPLEPPARADDASPLEVPVGALAGPPEALAEGGAHQEKE